MTSLLLDDDDAVAAAILYLERGGDPAAYADQVTIRRLLPWFLLHREPDHACEVCVSGAVIVREGRITHGRKAQALSYLINGGTPAFFDDQEAMRSVLPPWLRCAGEATPHHEPRKRWDPTTDTFATRAHLRSIGAPTGGVREWRERVRRAAAYLSSGGDPALHPDHEALRSAQEGM